VHPVDFHCTDSFPGCSVSNSAM